MLLAFLLVGAGAAVARGQELVLTNLTDPAPVNNNAVWDTGNDSNPSIATDGLGNWVCAWMSLNIPGGGVGNDLDILVARSTDGGATWTDPAYLNTNGATDTGHDNWPQVATDGAGTWVAVWASSENLGGTIGTDLDIVYARSFDNGITWTPPAVLASTAYGDGIESDRRPHLATDGQGVWVCVWESDARNLGTGLDSEIFYAVSTNNGATWGTTRFLNSRAQVDGFAIDGYPRVGTDRQGTWLCIWQSQDTLGGQIGDDYDILFARSISNGATWSAQSAVDCNATSDVATDQLPVAVWLTDRSLTAAWVSYDGTTGPDSDILYSYTLNHAQTWVCAAPLNVNAWTDSGQDFEVELGAAGSDAVIAIWASNEDLGGTIGADDDLLFALGIPASRSWSFPRVLNADAYWDNAFNRWFDVAGSWNNRWVVPWSGRDSAGWGYGTDWDVLGCRLGIDFLGDLDGDGDIDLSDFTIFQLCFGGSGNPPAPSCPAGVDADFDDDGDVDLADFLAFQRNFTGSR